MRLIHRLYIHCCHDCCNFQRHHPNNEPVNCLNFVGFVIVKLILEVFGAAGAIWGSSDVFQLRNDQFLLSNKFYTTNDAYRLFSLFTFTIFAIRFYWIIKHYLQHHHEYLPIKTEHRRSHVLTCCQMYAAKFVLQVLGGCGAIWGCSEVLWLRDERNGDSWRTCAAFVGCVFLVRWIVEIASYCLIVLPSRLSTIPYIARVVEWFEIVVVKAILEVFGAAGAIWGFSQIILLRTEETVEFWRAVAIVTLIGFTVRWLFIIVQFATSERDANTQLTHRDSNVVGEDDLDKADSEINDLALTETHTLNTARESSPPTYLSTPQNEDEEPVDIA